MACQKGMPVNFITVAFLVHELMEAQDEKRLLRLQRHLAKVKLLIVDERGFVPLSETGVELLFELISQRYECGSTLIKSNLPFEQWTETFGSERLTGALLDRHTAGQAHSQREYPRGDRRKLQPQSKSFTHEIKQTVIPKELPCQPIRPGTCLLYGDYTLQGRAPKWPTFASPQWNVFTTPSTPEVTPFNAIIVGFQSHSQDSLSSFASSKFIILIRVGEPS
jgi:hypothetical protein